MQIEPCYILSTVWTFGGCLGVRVSAGRGSRVNIIIIKMSHNHTGYWYMSIRRVRPIALLHGIGRRPRLLDMIGRWVHWHRRDLAVISLCVSVGVCV